MDYSNEYLDSERTSLMDDSDEACSIPGSFSPDNSQDGASGDQRSDTHYISHSFSFFLKHRLSMFLLIIATVLIFPSWEWYSQWDTPHAVPVQLLRKAGWCTTATRTPWYTAFLVCTNNYFALQQIRHNKELAFHYQIWLWLILIEGEKTKIIYWHILTWTQQRKRHYWRLDCKCIILFHNDTTNKYYKVRIVQTYTVSLLLLFCLNIIRWLIPSV